MRRTSTFSERLKIYREQNDLTLVELEKLTGVPAPTLNRYELGQRVPKIDVAIEIATALNVSPLWIQGYETDDPTPPDAKKDTQGEITLDDIDYALFGEVRELTDEDKEELLRNARRMVEARKWREQNPEEG